MCMKGSLNMKNPMCKLFVTIKYAHTASLIIYWHHCKHKAVRCQNMTNAAPICYYVRAQQGSLNIWRMLCCSNPVSVETIRPLPRAWGSICFIPPSLSICMSVTINTRSDLLMLYGQLLSGAELETNSYSTYTLVELRLITRLSGFGESAVNVFGKREELR